MDFTKVTENLKKRGFQVRAFATAAEAADYLDGAIDGVSVAFGGSVTLQQLGLAERLRGHNELFWHWQLPEGATAAEVLSAAASAQVYVTSVNALAETGELVNIDGTGNRLAGSLYGHKKVYFVAGRNKLAANFHEALWRARNVAAPLNAKRLGRRTPCVEGGRCFDCSSPERICRGLAVLWEKMGSCEMEVVLIDEELGY
ncbi:MAG: lactate utilization protein [Oscillospiraceae bacterium]